MHSPVAVAALGLAVMTAAQAVGDLDAPYLGCYETMAESYNPLRAVYAESWQKSGMGLSLCKRDCQSELPGYKLIGLSPVGCFCANALTDNLQLTTDDKCSVKCKSDDNTCGGIIRYGDKGQYVDVKYVSIYGDAASALPPPLLSGLANQTCWEIQHFGNTPEPPNPITPLDGPTYTDANGMTVNSCAEFCIKKGKNIIHLVNGDTCHCADAHLSTPRVERWQCLTPCTGNTLQFCGGTNHPQQQGIYASSWEFTP